MVLYEIVLNFAKSKKYHYWTFSDNKNPVGISVHNLELMEKLE